MDRCPYCGKKMYRDSSRQLFFGLGGGPFFWGFPGWGWGWVRKDRLNFQPVPF